MHIRIVAVGKIKDASLRSSVDEYYARIRHYARLEEQELKDGTDAELIGRFKKAVPERSRVVALEVDGKALSSDGLAAFVGQCQNEGVQNLVWLIGGADGLPQELSRRADLRLSLSSMTLPHRLARLVLAEQVYRAFTILRNEPYSH